MNVLRSAGIAVCFLITCIVFGHFSPSNYSMLMKAAVIPAFLLGVLSQRKIGYLLISPSAICLSILAPSWVQLHDPESVGAGDAFFWFLAVMPLYFFLYMSASLLGFFSKSLAKKKRK